MTTSNETDWMNHPEIRKLVADADRLTPQERMTLVKGLIPGIADALTFMQFEAFVGELRLKGERYYEARKQHGLGRDSRVIPGERELEQR